MFRFTTTQREEQDIANVVGVLFGAAPTSAATTAANTTVDGGLSRAGLDDEQLECLAQHTAAAKRLEGMQPKTTQTSLQSLLCVGYVVTPSHCLHD